VTSKANAFSASTDSAIEDLIPRTALGQ